jgi:hypothetical protein
LIRNKAARLSFRWCPAAWSGRRGSGFAQGLIGLSWLVLLLACTPLFAQDVEPTRSSEAAPVSATLCRDMRQSHVLNPGGPVGCDRLRLVTFSYWGFDAQLHRDGEIVVLDAMADQVLGIFETLRDRHFPIAKARLMNAYRGDDDASMDQDNTSAFNVRQIAGGGGLSLHAYGVAIDLNPIENPYIRRSGRGATVSPKAGAAYIRRTPARPGMSEEVIDVFADHGLTVWGGYWQNPTDYQHFQVSRGLAERLVRLSAADARALFETFVTRYRACVGKSAGATAARRACAAAVR